MINSQFINPLQSTANGDGLDLSGSQILAMNNQFSGFRDKGISIGEDSEVIVYKNFINRNNKGVAVKDLSHTYFIQNKFEDNEIDISDGISVMEYC